MILMKFFRGLKKLVFVQLVTHNYRVHPPYAAPSAGVFVGNNPQGFGRSRALPEGQEASGIRVAFSLVSFFW